jgi:hypothetical protein
MEPFAWLGGIGAMSVPEPPPEPTPEPPPEPEPGGPIPGLPDDAPMDMPGIDEPPIRMPRENPDVETEL